MSILRTNALLILVLLLLLAVMFLTPRVLQKEKAGYFQFHHLWDPIVLGFVLLVTVLLTIASFGPAELFRCFASVRRKRRDPEEDTRALVAAHALTRNAMMAGVLIALISHLIDWMSLGENFELRHSRDLLNTAYGVIIGGLIFNFLECPIRRKLGEAPIENKLPLDRSYLIFMLIVAIAMTSLVAIYLVRFSIIGPP